MSSLDNNMVKENDFIQNSSGRKISNVSSFNNFEGGKNEASLTLNSNPNSNLNLSPYNNNNELKKGSNGSINTTSKPSSPKGRKKNNSFKQHSHAHSKSRSDGSSLDSLNNSNPNLHHPRRSQNNSFSKNSSNISNYNTINPPSPYYFNPPNENRFKNNGDDGDGANNREDKRNTSLHAMVLKNKKSPSNNTITPPPSNINIKDTRMEMNPSSDKLSSNQSNSIVSKAKYQYESLSITNGNNIDNNGFPQRSPAYKSKSKWTGYPFSKPYNPGPNSFINNNNSNGNGNDNDNGNSTSNDNDNRNDKNDYNNYNNSNSNNNYNYYNNKNYNNYSNNNNNYGNNKPKVNTSISSFKSSPLKSPRTPLSGYGKSKTSSPLIKIQTDEQIQTQNQNQDQNQKQPPPSAQRNSGSNQAFQRRYTFKNKSKSFTTGFTGTSGSPTFNSSPTSAGNNFGGYGRRRSSGSSNNKRGNQEFDNGDGYYSGGGGNGGYRGGRKGSYGNNGGNLNYKFNSNANANGLTINTSKKLIMNKDGDQFLEREFFTSPLPSSTPNSGLPYSMYSAYPASPYSYSSYQNQNGNNGNNRNNNNRFFSEIDYTTTQNTRKEWIRKVHMQNDGGYPSPSKGTAPNYYKKINNTNNSPNYNNNNYYNKNKNNKNNTFVNNNNNNNNSNNNTNSNNNDNRSGNDNNQIGSFESLYDRINPSELTGNSKANTIDMEGGIKPSMVKQMKNNGRDLKETFLDFQNTRSQNHQATNSNSNSGTTTTTTTTTTKNTTVNSNFALCRLNFERLSNPNLTNTNGNGKNNNNSNSNRSGRKISKGFISSYIYDNGSGEYFMKHSRSLPFEHQPTSDSLSMVKRPSLMFTDFSSSHSNLYNTTAMTMVPIRNKRSYKIAQLLQFFENVQCASDTALGPYRENDLYSTTEKTLDESKNDEDQGQEKSMEEQEEVVADTKIIIKKEELETEAEKAETKEEADIETEVEKMNTQDQEGQLFDIKMNIETKKLDDSIIDLISGERKPIDFSIKAHSCSKLNEILEKKDDRAQTVEKRNLKNTPSLPNINKELITEIFNSLLLDEQNQHRSGGGRLGSVSVSAVGSNVKINGMMILEDDPQNKIKKREKYLSGMSNIKNIGYTSYHIKKPSIDNNTACAQADIVNNSNMHTLKGFLTSKNKKKRIYESIEKLFEGESSSVPNDEPKNIGAPKFIGVALQSFSGSTNSKSKQALKFKENDVLEIFLEKDDKYYYGKLNGQGGWFPKSYVSVKSKSIDEDNSNNNDSTDNKNNETIN